MSEPTPQPPAPFPPPAAPAPAPHKSTWAYTLAFSVLALACGTGYYFYEKSRNPLPLPVDELKSLKDYLTQLATTQKLGDGYTDADGDLVADRPTEASKLAKVGDELLFSVVGTEDEKKLDEAEKGWASFTAALAKATGKKVMYARDFTTVDAQMAGIREGRLHITAFNTGAVPTAVNTAGFVPLFTPANEKGDYGYTVEVLVRSGSDITSPSQLKNRQVGFVALSSNSGAKAPMVEFKERFGLLPVRDYTYTITGDHVRSVRELVAGKHQAVCVASDLLHDALARPAAEGGISKNDVRSVYSSKPFPQLCFGVPHNLPAELRAQIEGVFASFQFAGTSVEGTSVGRGRTKFIRVAYKTAWAPVREVNEKLTRLFNEK